MPVADARFTVADTPRTLVVRRCEIVWRNSYLSHFAAYAPPAPLSRWRRGVRWGRVVLAALVERTPVVSRSFARGPFQRGTRGPLIAKRSARYSKLTRQDHRGFRTSVDPRQVGEVQRPTQPSVAGWPVRHSGCPRRRGGSRRPPSPRSPGGRNACVISPRMTVKRKPPAPEAFVRPGRDRVPDFISVAVEGDGLRHPSERGPVGTGAHRRATSSRKSPIVPVHLKDPHLGSAPEGQPATLWSALLSRAPWARTASPESDYSATRAHPDPGEDVRRAACCWPRWRVGRAC